MLIIANGTIVDGTGSESFPGDVVVDGDRIADVVRGGAATRGDAEVIDARGCLVTPGFIDSHAHSDAYLVLEPDVVQQNFRIAVSLSGVTAAADFNSFHAHTLQNGQSFVQRLGTVQIRKYTKFHIRYFLVCKFCWEKKPWGKAGP